MDVAVIGAGRVGTAVGVLLTRAGHRIVAASGRAGSAHRIGRYLPGVPLRDAPAAAASADLVVIATPDDVIASTVETIAAEGAFRPGAWAAHLSGALGLDALKSVPDGVRRLAIHPLQTFPDVESALLRIRGCPVAVTADDADGERLGESLARDLGGVPFPLADERRPLYHAAAVFASNYVVTVTALAEELERAAGMPDPIAALTPLQDATLANVRRVGPAEALTGPAVRGDAITLQRNLEALAEHAPHAVRPYVALADLALALAERSGRFDPRGREAVEEVLARWR